MSTSISAVILTFNEEKHIARCIKSLIGLCDSVYVIDSFSTDNTVEIAEELGVNICQNAFVNHAAQFNWALSNCDIQSDWIFRIDGDEYLENIDAIQIRKSLDSLPIDVNGIHIKRKIKFLGKVLMHGGWYPKWVIRIFRRGYGICENQWMDEHIVLTEGKSIPLNVVIVDENLNSLGWWISKHNNYASKAVVDYFQHKNELNRKIGVKPNIFGIDAERKRWLKNKYYSFPIFIRPFFSFFYYYFFRLGFMDGTSGFIWYVLQGFWYRFIVDAKIYELKRQFNNNPDLINQYLKTNNSVDHKDSHQNIYI